MTRPPTRVISVDRRLIARHVILGRRPGRVVRVPPCAAARAVDRLVEHRAGSTSCARARQAVAGLDELACLVWRTRTGRIAAASDRRWGAGGGKCGQSGESYERPSHSDLPWSGPSTSLTPTDARITRSFPGRPRSTCRSAPPRWNPSHEPRRAVYSPACRYPRRPALAEARPARPDGVNFRRRCADPARITLADHSEGLPRLWLMLDGLEESEVVGEARTDRETVGLAVSAAPGLLLLDLSLPTWVDSRCLRTCGDALRLAGSSRRPGISSAPNAVLVQGTTGSVSPAPARIVRSDGERTLSPVRPHPCRAAELLARKIVSPAHQAGRRCASTSSDPGCAATRLIGPPLLGAVVLVVYLVLTGGRSLRWGRGRCLSRRVGRGRRRRTSAGPLAVRGEP